MTIYEDLQWLYMRTCNDTKGREGRVCNESFWRIEYLQFHKLQCHFVQFNFLDPLLFRSIVSA